MNDNNIISITQLLSNYYFKDNKFIKDNAKEKGTALHLIFQDLIKERKANSNADKKLLEDLDNVLGKYNILLQEKKIYSNKLKYSGTPDLIIDTEKKGIVVIEFKSYIPDKDYISFQLSAQKQLYETEFKAKVNECRYVTYDEKKDSYKISYPLALGDIKQYTKVFNKIVERHYLEIEINSFIDAKKKREIIL